MYSYNNNYPVETLYRIRLSSGATRTSEFTEEELADAGWKIVSSKPECESTQLVDWNYDTGEWYIRDKFAYEIEADKTALWDPIIRKRDELLRESDSTQLADSFQDCNNSNILIKLWAIYRRKLRDITKDFSTPSDVVWPDKPTQYDADVLGRLDLARQLEYFSNITNNVITRNF